MAALSVAAYHLRGMFPALYSSSEQSPFYKAAFAVDLFFLLSGMILAHVYYRQFSRRVNGADYWAFVRNRFARIYPLHLATLAAMVVLVAFTRYWPLSLEGRYSIEGLVHNLLLTHSPWLGYRTWDFPSWSISAEWHAYILFPLLLPLFVRLKPLPAAVLGGVLASIAIYVVALPERISNGPEIFLRLLPWFCGGMLVYRLILSGRAASFGHPVAVAAITAGLVLSIALSAPDWAVVGWFPLLVLATVHGHGPVVDGLNSRPMIYLGDLSYSVYMNHAVLIFAWPLVETAAGQAGLPSLNRGSLGFAAAAGYLTALIGILLVGSAVTYHWIERPARRLLRQRAAPASPRKAPGSSYAQSVPSRLLVDDMTGAGNADADPIVVELKSPEMAPSADVAVAHRPAPEV